MKEIVSTFVNRLFFLALMIFTFSFVASAQSQVSSGQITGVVTDATGGLVSGATVTMTSKATNATQTQTTTGEGIYRFVLVPPGNYIVKAVSSGFTEQTADVEVQIGRTTDANFSLGVGKVSAQVEVTAEGIQSTSNQFDAVQSETAIQNLPINGRRFQDFVTLTPSAQVDPSRGQISLSGQRGINGSVNVDGLDYNQPFFGGVRGGERSNQAFTLPQESVREFQVVSAGYSAEYGRSSGGVVSVLTKSGTNQLRGSAFYLLRPKKLAKANKYADALNEQRLSQIVINGVQGVEATLAPTQQQFGGSVGGPIIKDKLFFFGSYEQQRFRAPRQVLFGNLVGVVPTATQTEAFNFYRALEVPFEQTNDAYAGIGKIDWKITGANDFSFRYNFSRNKALNAVATGETALDPTTTNSLSTNGTERNKNNIYVAQLKTAISANVYNEFRGQYAHEVRPRLANTQIANINTSVGVYGTRNFMPTTQYDKRWQAADSLIIINGNHQFKVGGEFSNIYANQTFGFNQFGVYTFAGLAGGTGGVLDAVSTTRTATVRGRFDQSAARYNQQIGNLLAAYTVKEVALFGQDSWRVSPKLTLNYGLRYEKQLNPTEEANNTPVIDLVKTAAYPLYGGKSFDPTKISDSQDEWGPRVGFAYDPMGDGKTVFRGYSGVYYARTPLLVLAAPFNNFRNPAGDLSVTLGGTALPTGFSQTTFDAANPGYVAIVGGTGFAPTTLYRQFAILGINLNTVALGSLPTLTPAQLQAVFAAINSATPTPPVNLGVFQNANVIGIAPNFKNPMSFQFGGGFEREVAKGITVGLDYSQVNTVYLQRNRELNLPAPVSLAAFAAANGVVLTSPNDDAAQRPYIGVVRGSGLPSTLPLRARPIPSLASVQMRESSARSLYRGLTFRMNMSNKRVRLNTFYTLSKNLSNDDNERDAGGVLYDNPADLTTEYGLSRLDRRHQFVANPVVFLPLGIEVASTVRLRSGVPVNAIVNTDLNGDGLNNDRPMLQPGYEIRRNAFRNKNVYDIDLRIQKGFKFGESRRLILSSEFFNVFNFSNVQIASTTTTSYCATSNQRCGLDGITNPNFLQVREQRPTATVNGLPSLGKILLANNPGSQVFQMQVGARLQF